MRWSCRLSVVVVVLIVVVGVTVIRAGDETASTASPASSSSSTSTAPPAATEPAPTPTYYDFYKEGRIAYTKERWFEAVDLLERAIEDWRWYRDELAQCRVKCRKVRRTGMRDVFNMHLALE